ncbi:MAG: response regulator [Bacteroidetes bacterium]|nr:MAG: response regulator [Bacteroidota bacterium]
MKKILIIEDNPEVRENLEEILELYDYETATAENGTVGVQKALSDPPDLILCDVMMPELDGFGVLNILSRKPATSDIPFVFLTAKSEKEDIRRGMNLGADDYITKPFYKDELLQVIETRLRKSERLKTRFDRNQSGLAAFINEARGYEELKKLSVNQKKQTYKKKEMLFLEGDIPRYLYFVNSGKVKLYKSNEYGKEYIIRLCGPGDFFGYSALIKDEHYPFSAAMMETTELSLIPKKDFLQLLYSNRDVTSRFIKILVDNIAEKEEKLLQLAYDSIRKRVANALIMLHEKEGKTELTILRDDLARIVGTAKESVIRMLTEFKQDRYIDIQDGKIVILNKKGLESMPG